LRAAARSEVWKTVRQNSDTGHRMGVPRRNGLSDIHQLAQNASGCASWTIIREIEGQGRMQIH
jgi:hypothetical protein